MSLSSAKVVQPFLSFFFPAGLLLFLSLLRDPWQVVAVAAYVLAWAVWSWAVRKGASLKVPAVFVAVALLVVFAIGNNPRTLFLLWIGVVVVSIGYSRRASYLYAAIPVLTTAGVHFFAGSSLLRILSETLTVALMMGIGAQLAELTSRVAREAIDRRTLILAEERSRIASALHDSLGHRLTSASMSLDFIDRAWGSEQAHEEVRITRKTIVDGLDEMRTVVRSLAPMAVREDFGSTLRELEKSFATTGLQVRVHGAARYTDEQEQLLLAVVQEALTNTVRHAHAQRVTITMGPRCFVFADDGIGGEVTEGFGLRSLRERAEEIGASLILDGSDGLRLEVRL